MSVVSVVSVVSAGVLFSFNLTNTSLIMIRKCAQVPSTNNNSNNNKPCEFLLVRFHVAALAFAFAFVSLDFSVAFSSVTLPGVLCACCVLLMMYQCAQLSSQTAFPDVVDEDASTQYRVPFVPLTPMIGIVINYVLIAQQSWVGLGLMMVYFVLATIFYFWYGSADAPWKAAVENSADEPAGKKTTSEEQILLHSSHGNARSAYESL